MQSDPAFEWQRLTEYYRQMSDDELRELTADFDDLTETAQQALRSEMRSRGLGDSVVASNVSGNANSPFASPAAPITVSTEIVTRAPTRDRMVNALGFFGQLPEIVPDTPDAGGADDAPHEYTWKTVLCKCDDMTQALEVSEALKQAGIESWIAGPRPSAYSSYASLDLINPRVLVAADQLDQARAIAARPIPPEIVAESRIEVPDFEPPICPTCGASDPVLEAVDPANTWRCEQCGGQWTESAGSANQEAPGAGSVPL
jgi:hypothetical protein